MGTKARMALSALAVVAVCGTAAVLVAQRSRTGEARKVGQECTLKVDGMVCGSCANRVQTVAKRVDGVGDVVVSHARGTAQITYDPARTNPAAIAQAITDNAGFKSEVTK
jgi:copper chaperone CopZ